MPPDEGDAEATRELLLSGATGAVLVAGAGVAALAVGEAIILHRRVELALQASTAGSR